MVKRMNTSRKQESIQILLRLNKNLVADIDKLSTDVGLSRTSWIRQTLFLTVKGRQKP